MNPKLNRVLEDIRHSLEERAGIVSVDTMGSPTTQTVPDMFFDFMDEITADLSLVYGMSEADAFEFAGDVGDAMAEKGHLPPFPDDEMNDAEIARWVNAATYSSFRSEVRRQAALCGCE